MTYSSKDIDPIEDKTDIVKMFNFMIKHGHVREAHAFVIGCNVALRVSDLFQLKFEQFENSQKSANIIEIKTEKGKLLTFNATVHKHVKLLKEWYKEQYIDPVYLFQSTSKNTRKIQPVSSSWMNRIISNAGEAVGLEYNVGTHSMRKSFCFHAYQNGTDIHEIQKILNHSKVEITKLYIGLTKRRIAQAYHDNAISVL